MADDWQAQVSRLLQGCRTGFLATMGEYGPETSMTPFAMYKGCIVLHLSSLARHRKNIAEHNHVGFMVCTPETSHRSPLSLPRVSVQGEMMPVAEADLASVKEAYIRKIHEAEPLFSFADFRLFQIVPAHIQWIGGFGAARNIKLRDWCAMFGL